MAKTEVVENQLQVLVQQSGLENTKAQYILNNFQGYFAIAAEWEKKAKMIVVTDASQKADMDMARVGRLFLKDKRVELEKARKKLKEDALREGKIIDNISNVLKALIVPIEEYLDQQERFVEIKEEEKREAVRLEIEKRIEDERIAKEKADAEALEKARIENEKLKAEAVKALDKQKKQATSLIKERAKAQVEREEQERKILAERKKAEAEKKLVEEKARLEREKQEKTLANERAKAKRLKELADEKAKAKLEAERKEKERLEELLKNQVECPFCHKRFNLDNANKK